MITTLREIAERPLVTRNLRGRIDARGCVSIPEGMGSVTLTCEEDGDNLVLTAHMSDEPRKRFHYVGLNYMKQYVDDWTERSILFKFTPSGPKSWTAIINRRGQQD